MTEAKIEKIIIDKIGAALSAADVTGIQFMGAWQTGEEKPKATEETSATGFVAVKVRPRTYDTPTIPDANIQADIALTVRADMDSCGKDYLAVTDLVENVIHAWQKSFGTYAADFTLENEFTPTGFQIDASEIGLDKESCVWQFAQSVSLYGIVND